MHLSTSGGDVQAARCRAVNASINTAAGATGQQQQLQDAAALGVQLSGGDIQVWCVHAAQIDPTVVAPHFCVSSSCCCWCGSWQL
jgi:hypothetical protein